MSSPMSSTSVPSQNCYQKHFEGLTDHLSMNLSYSMHKNSALHPQQIERQSFEEEVPVVQLERPLVGPGKPRMRWTHELHTRFLRAASEVGGISVAKPKLILERMNVKGLTPEQIKSHLQKVRKNNAKQSMHQGIHYGADNHYPPLFGQGSSTSRSNALVNGKGLESFQVDINAYGKLLQSYETPMYYQNLMFAPMGEYQDNANGLSFGL